MTEYWKGIAILTLLAFRPGVVLAQSEATQKAQPAPVELSDAVLNRLPSAYRSEARSMVTAPEENQQRWLKLPDEDLTAAVVEQLGRSAAAADFLLAQLEKEPSAKLRGRIIGSLDWRSHPQSQAILEHHAASDRDPGVALQALEMLRKMRMDELGKLLQVRMDAAKAGGDSAGLAKLAQEQDRRYLWFDDIKLPGFLKMPPPIFSVKSVDQPIRVLAFGDFGFGNEAQKNTASAMVSYHRTHPFDFGITLGDNFYTYGMDSTSDPRWQTQWEQLYGPLGIKFYPSFGNHDYGQADSPAAEILYSAKSPDWTFPAEYYTYTAGPVQFFAIDTVDVSDAELLWLDSELQKSEAVWRVVYGHYPIYSATGEDKSLGDKLLPVLKDRVDVYLTGHHHNLQELRAEGRLHFFVSGGGGATLYGVDPKYTRSIFQDKINGFTVLEADAKHFKVSFIGTDGKELHSSTLEK